MLYLLLLLLTRSPGCGHLCPQVNQPSLYLLQLAMILVVQLALKCEAELSRLNLDGVRLPLTYQPDGSIKFVDRSQAFEYVVVLVESVSGPERALAFVSCLCVNLHSSVSGVG